MKKLLFIMAMVVVFVSPLFAQMGIGTTSPNSSAMLDIVSTSRGLLVPRMTTIQREAISAPADGLIVYDLTLHSFWFYKNGTWTDFSSGGYWSRNGTNTYLSNINDRVGIGTSAPSYSFHLNNATGTAVFSYNPLGTTPMTNVEINNDIFEVLKFTTRAGTGLSRYIAFYDNYDGNGMGIKWYHNNINKMSMYNFADKLLFGSNSFDPFMILDGATGNVGIGTNNPNAKLQVAGYINFEDAQQSTAIGAVTGSSASGFGNTYLGYHCGQASTLAGGNTFVGSNIGTSTTTGSSNTAIGNNSFNNNTIGIYNIAI